MSKQAKSVVSFSKLRSSMPMPHFLDVQLQAFERLVQSDQRSEDRQDLGLERVFNEIFPITDVNENFSLEFVDYGLGEPKYTVKECIERDMTYAAPLKATLRLIMFEKLGDGEKRPRDILEKEVYLGDLPLLTEQGTFVVNGAERVIVSQLHRSPGVVFEQTIHPNGTRLFSARIIPFRGSWVEFTLDIHDVIYVHIDKKKKFPATALLRAFGHGTNGDILDLFYDVREFDITVPVEEGGPRREVLGTLLAESIPNSEFEGEKVSLELKGSDLEEMDAVWLTDGVDHPESGERLASPGDRLDDTLFRRFTAAGVAEVQVFDDEEAFVARRGDEMTEELIERLERAGIGRVMTYSSAAFIPMRGSFADLAMRRDWSQNPQLATDVVDASTGEVLHEAGELFTEELFAKLRESRVREALIFTGGPRGESPLIKNTLAKDPTDGEAAALHSIYSLVRPGEAPNLETARGALDRLFFNPKRYDLGRVGRHKVNQRLKDVYRLLDFELPSEDTAVLTPHDFVAILRYLVELHEGRGYTDDIDHLGNRRVRSIGELIANQFSVGLSRMARLVRERMSINSDPEKLSIDDLVNARTVSAVIQSFFGSSQLSQFLDQTNPLAELTHKRRLSALGPGGLTRERAGFEVRDVHYSHYGRMCPIETPEGPNIGLITSMTTFAQLNELGFLETPYRPVVDGRVTDEDEVVWLSASEEEEYSVAQANAELDEDGRFKRDLVLSRRRDDYPLLPRDEIDFMDVAPEQIVAVSPALIPFLEHDDANRALMGSNMQRQAVPLLFPDAPLVGTGLEKKVAQDSGAVVLARRAGKVTKVTADEIVVDTGQPRGGAGELPLARLTQYDRYQLKKFVRTNQDTSINQRPIVRLGDRVKKGQVIADGAATEDGSLALGQNLLVAFMPWYGHNFEDAIVISERLTKTDALTSVHIQELELHVRDTKRGMEEITREIPNVAEEALVDLDERGIVRVGATVKSGDVLVGKITPKGETELSPEEKLLTAIFGEKAKDVKDSALRVPPGVEGKVIDVKIFSRRIDDPLLEQEHGERIADLREVERSEIGRVRVARDEELREILKGQAVALFLKRGTIEPLFSEGTKLTVSNLADLDFGTVDLSTLKVKKAKTNDRVRRLIEESKARAERIRERTEEGIDKVFQPDELSPGVVQLVKVYLAEKRKIAVGDKMAGRHGNKGIIARVVPEEDMPFLPDGTAVEIVLNPLGVPSRMNVGQILETLLGWAGEILGFRSETPVFQGASEHEIGALLKIAGSIWAARSLGSDVEPPTLGPEEARMLAEGIQLTGGGQVARTNGAGVGLGRQLDGYLASPVKGLRDFMETFAHFLVEVARDLSGGTISEKLREDGWDAAADLVGARRIKSGVDAAVNELMSRAGLRPQGKARLRDGRTGEEFDADVTVGMIYMMKLSHLVDDKIHARSIGPYSLVTQQPLAGKAQFGGQRFGEMEVWALEAYGAAHTLQEMLTVKSDDVSGRSRVYEAVVKGENLPQPGVPESFNVLIKELQALGLSVTLGKNEENGFFTE